MHTFEKVRYWLGEGCQNRFILFDLMATPHLFTDELVREAVVLLNRLKRDDVLILLPSSGNDKEVILSMIVLEPDGSFANFCGNGSRVVASYLYGTYGQKTYILKSGDALRSLSLAADGNYEVNMLQTTFDVHNNDFMRDAGTYFNSHSGIYPTATFSFAPDVEWYFTQTGEPHLVTYADITKEQLERFGSELNTKYRHLFPHGINVNSVQIIDAQTLHISTYERGLNRISNACGSGATSSAVLSYKLGLVNKQPIIVHMTGGSLQITHNPTDNSSLMSGPAFMEDQEHYMSISRK